MIPEAQHLDALFGEELVAFLIPGALVWETMPAAVEFDREIRERAIEIEVVNPAGVLATEFELSEPTVAKQTPEPLLGIGGFSAELAGKVAGGG
jgi:hypothetical protein